VKRSLIRSFACAFRGIYITLKSERSYRIHFIALIVAVALGLYLHLSVLEWALITFSIGFVLVAELFNTVVERLGDEIAGGKHHEMVRNIKDISAAAVLLSAITALIIGVLILFIPLVRSFIR
jgi:diacylglycerol kinase